MPLACFARRFPSTSCICAVGHLPFATFCTSFKSPCLLDVMRGQLGPTLPHFRRWPSWYCFGLLLCSMGCPLCLMGEKFWGRLNVCPSVKHVTLNCTDHLEPACICFFHLWVATVGKSTLLCKRIGLLVASPIFDQKALLLGRLWVMYVGPDPLN